MEITNDQQQLNGIRFDPTDGQLIVHFLKKYIMKESMSYNRIEEVDVFAHCPQIVTEKHHPLGEKKWYFFTPRNPRYQNGKRPSRRLTGDGYWKATGGDKPVSHNGQTVGFKMRFVFNEGKPGKGEKTNWIMHEYKVKKSDDAKFDGLVLCRIYKRNVKSSKNKQEPVDSPSQILSSVQQEPAGPMLDAAAAPDPNWNDMLDMINCSELDFLIRSDPNMDSSLTSTLPPSSINHYQYCPTTSTVDAAAANTTELQVMFNQLRAILQDDIVTPPPQIHYSHPKYPARFEEEHCVTEENDWNCGVQNYDWNCGEQNYVWNCGEQNYGWNCGEENYDSTTEDDQDQLTTTSVDPPTTLVSGVETSRKSSSSFDDHDPPVISLENTVVNIEEDKHENNLDDGKSAYPEVPACLTNQSKIIPDFTNGGAFPEVPACLSLPNIVNIEEETTENNLDGDLDFSNFPQVLANIKDILSGKYLEDDNDYSRLLDDVPEDHQHYSVS